METASCWIARRAQRAEVDEADGGSDAGSKTSVKVGAVVESSERTKSAASAEGSMKAKQ